MRFTQQFLQVIISKHEDIAALLQYKYSPQGGAVTQLYENDASLNEKKEKNLWR